MSDHDALRAAVTESPAVLHDLGDILEVGILTLDAQLVIRGCNHWLEVAAERGAEELVGRSLFDVFPELRGSPPETAFRGALAGMSTVLSQRFHRYLLPLPPPAGFEGLFDRMQQSARILPLVRDDRVEGVIALVQDVTERIAREAELRDATRRAEVASEAKSEFLASISHELRTPLSAVIGYTDLLEGGMVGPVEPLQQNYLGRIRLAARHLLNIIEEILTFSRVEAGHELADIELLDAIEVAWTVHALFEPQCAQKGLALVVQVPDAPVPVWSDVTKLRQILINLMGNAVKFTDAGSVTLELAPAGDRLAFHVHDTGPGISPADVERVFEPFTQLDGSRTRNKGGTGLGLPLSQKLAHLLGGSISISSVEGQGTTFTLHLPVGSEPSRYPEEPAAQAVPSG